MNLFANVQQEWETVFESRRQLGQPEHETREKKAEVTKREGGETHQINTVNGWRIVKSKLAFETIQSRSRRAEVASRTRAEEGQYGSEGSALRVGGRARRGRTR